MTIATSRRHVLASRPEGWPTQENFRLESAELPDLAGGQVRVANEFLSVDPYMRGRMIDRESYVAPFHLDEPLTGGAVGRVIASRSDEVPEGAAVLHQHGWRDIAQGDAEDFTVLEETPGVPLSLRLHLLGMTGMTAYAGLVDVARLREGDRVFVSGAAGAVGTAVGQFARLLGASQVIGSAGSEEKTRLLTEKYGYDVGLNYQDAPIREQLADAAPDGIDVFFDNVGGDHLEAAIDTLNRFGRGALCGAISEYNLERPRPGPDNMNRLVTHSLSLRGYIVVDLAEEYRAEFAERTGQWLRDGDLVYDETVVDGLENTVDAFIDMMRGGNTGKMLVKVADSAR